MAIFSTLFLKTLHDYRRPLLFGGVGLALLGLLAVLLFPALHSRPLLEPIQDLIPPVLNRMLFRPGIEPDSPAGYLNSGLLTLIAPLLISGLAIAIGSEMLAGEERHGQLELLLALPLSRRRLVRIKAAALGCMTILLALGLWIGLLPGPRVALTVEPFRLLAAAGNLALLALNFGMLALAIGAKTGNPRLSRSTAWSFLALTLLLESLTPAFNGPEALRWLSPFYHYSRNDPLGSGGATASILFLGGLSLVFLFFALDALSRRDLPVGDPTPQ